MFQDIFFLILWNLSNISCSSWSVNISFKHSTVTIILMRCAQTCSISTWQSFSYKHCIILFNHSKAPRIPVEVVVFNDLCFQVYYAARSYIKTNQFLYYMVIKGTFDFFYFFHTQHFYLQRFCNMYDQSDHRWTQSQEIVPSERSLHLGPLVSSHKWVHFGICFWGCP